MIFIASFLAGMLTIAAPCILPLLPVIVGGSASTNSKSSVERLRPIITTVSLVVSIFAFTFLIKLTSIAFGVPSFVWQMISGCLLGLIGIHFLFPNIWPRIALATRLYSSSHHALDQTSNDRSIWGAVLLGAALGPVFNSCSPTYLFIVAQILPESLSTATVAMLAYAVGLGIAVLAVSYFGRGIINKLGWIENPRSWFNRTVGILLLLTGIAIITGFDKTMQTFVIEQGWYAPISTVEERLLPQ